MEIKTLTVVRSETETEDDIIAGLAGRVFHVTMRSHFDRILSCGEIRPNRDGALTPGFGYPNSFFRKRGCVCLFDYRENPTEEILDFRRRCWPFQLAEPDGEGIAILVFKPELETALIPWTRWKDEEAYGDMIVPHVEAGHEGAIGVEMIEEVIFFRRTEDPNSFGTMLRNALKD